MMKRYLVLVFAAAWVGAAMMARADSDVQSEVVDGDEGLGGMKVVTRKAKFNVKVVTTFAKCDVI